MYIQSYSSQRNITGITTHTSVKEAAQVLQSQLYKLGK